MPGRPAPSRAAGGRGGRWSPAPPPAGAPGWLVGAGRRPMPWLGANGLLPGRGVPPGRPTGRGAGARGAGLGAAGALAAGGVAAGAAGAAGAGASAATAEAAGASGAGGSGVSGALGARGPGRGPGRGAVLAPDSSAAGVDSAGAAAFLAGAFFAGALAASAGAAAAEPPAAFSCSPYSFLKRIATGGSTVEDADLTNSPISFSFSRTNLLSTPNSLASSWTRGLATLLLLAPNPCPADCRVVREAVSGCACSSGSTHRVLMSCCSSFCRSSRSGAEQGDVVFDGADLRLRIEPQGSGERTASNRQFQALGRGVQVCAATGSRAARIRYDGSCRRPRALDDSQQLALSGPLPASDAGPDGTREGTLVRACGRTAFSNHCGETLLPQPPESRTGSARAQASLPGSSERMSMRHPVRRAARRAF